MKWLTVISNSWERCINHGADQIKVLLPREQETTTAKFHNNHCCLRKSNEKLRYRPFKSHFQKIEIVNLLAVCLISWTRLTSSDKINKWDNHSWIKHQRILKYRSLGYFPPPLKLTISSMPYSILPFFPSTKLDLLEDNKSSQYNLSLNWFSIILVHDIQLLEINVVRAKCKIFQNMF